MHDSWFDVRNVFFDLMLLYDALHEIKVEYHFYEQHKDCVVPDKVPIPLSWSDFFNKSKPEH